MCTRVYGGKFSFDAGREEVKNIGRERGRRRALKNKKKIV